MSIPRGKAAPAHRVAALWLLGAGIVSCAPPPPPEPVRAPLAAPTSPHAPPFGSAARLASAVDGYMRGFGSAWGPGWAPGDGVLVVAQDGAPLVQRAYGSWGDRSAADASWPLGPIAKPLVAAITLRLAARRTLAPSDRVRAWVPELSSAYDGLTLHHLLSQTSGLPPLEVPSGSAASLGWLPALAARAPERPAGERFADSDADWALLALVAERASKRPFAELVRAELGALAAGPPLQGRMRDRDGALVPAPTATAPGVALRASLRDLLRFDENLADPRWLEPDARAALATGWADVPRGGRSGYGFVIDRVGADEVAWQGGASGGFSTFYLRAPSRGLVIVLLSNNGSFDAVSAGLALARIALLEQALPPVTERAVAPVDAAFAARVIGRFALSPEGREALAQRLPPAAARSLEELTLRWDGARLELVPAGQAAVTLRRLDEGSRDHLYSPASDLEIAPVSGADGAERPPGEPWPGLSVIVRGAAIDYQRKRKLTRLEIVE